MKYSYPIDICVFPLFLILLIYECKIYNFLNSNPKFNIFFSILFIFCLLYWFSTRLQSTGFNEINKNAKLKIFFFVSLLFIYVSVLFLIPFSVLFTHQRKFIIQIKYRIFFFFIIRV